MPDLDRELDLARLLGFAGGLLAVLVATGAVAWALVSVLAPPAAPAVERPPPPAPRLQAAPSDDLEALRASEEARLSAWGWTDREANLARVPIERAMELLAR